MDVSIQYDGGGCHVLWFREGDEHECRWYGSREACESRAKEPPPDEGWVPVSGEGSPPYDAATATGMYDH